MLTDTFCNYDELSALKVDSSERKYNTALEISSVVAIRPIGCIAGILYFKLWRKFICFISHWHWSIDESWRDGIDSNIGFSILLLI